MLAIKSIDTYYGKVQVLKEVSLEIPSRKIVTLLGANGAGKTITMRTIMGFIVPAKGEIEFEGRRINGFSPSKIVRLGISLVPERRLIFPQMTVLENLGMGAFIRRDTRKIREDLNHVYGLFPILQERRKQLGATLSGGEQQMLALGRGLMSDPKLILLDEISLGLAPLIVNELYRVLKEIREKGITILFVEQNVRRSLIEAERAYILEAGRVVLNGSVADLREEERVKKAYFGA